MKLIVSAFCMSSAAISGFLFGLSDLHWPNEMWKSLVKTLLRSKKVLFENGLSPSCLCQ